MAGKPFDILMGLIGMTRKDTGEQRADSLGSTADRMAECDQNRVRPEAEFTIDPADFMKVRTILKGTGIRNMNFHYGGTFGGDQGRLLPLITVSISARNRRQIAPRCRENGGWHGPVSSPEETRPGPRFPL